MRSMTGIRRAGLLAILAAVLLPASGIGIAVADLNVGDERMLEIPDLGEFPEENPVRKFTCRAVTEHAVWLVQDTTYFDTEDPLPVWGEVFDQTELDSLTEQFEGGGVEVYGTVTSTLGAVPDTPNDDEKLWMVFADIPDYYLNRSTYTQYRVGMKNYVWPADINGDSEEGNNHDIIYINVGVYRDYPQEALKSFFHSRAIPDGLAKFIRKATNPNEDRWLVRGLGVQGIYNTYGFTTYGNNVAGIGKYVNLFSRNPFIDLSLWNSGAAANATYFDANRGGAWLFISYLQQRTDSDILPTLMGSQDYAGMLSLAKAVDPGAGDSTAIEEVLIPLYNDFIIAVAVGSYAEDYEDGQYTFDILNEAGYDFAVADVQAGTDGEGVFLGYPVDSIYVSPLTRSAAWSARYTLFSPDTATGQMPTEPMYVNGQYNQNQGSGPNYNSKWYMWKVVLENDALASVSQVDLSDMYNGQLTLEGDSTLLVSTNNNPGGTPEMAMCIGNKTSDHELLLALMQNLANPQYIQAYTSLYSTGPRAPYGFDWAGPGVTATKGDSTLMAPMEKFSGTIWGGVINLWEAGDYDISCTGWDSLGIAHTQTAELECGYSEQEGMVLDITEARLDVEDGSGAPGQMVVLMETGMLGLSVSSSIPISGAAEAMTGVIAGPVSVSDVAGNLSFPANDSHGAVYRWNGEGWDRIESSYYQSGRMHAMIDGGGIYVYGEAPGVVSPEVPAEMGINGSYPNPFMAQAAISFSLPQAGRASVKVFDLSGRLVRTLADGEMAAADHTVVWDGCDASGNEVGAGVYFCRLEASGQTATQKMLRIE